MDVMNLYTMKKTYCFSITEFSGNDFLQEEELCRSLRHLKAQKPTQVASYEQCSSLNFLFPLVLRCITDKFFSCGRFPQKEDIVNSWFDGKYGGEPSRMMKTINVVKEAGTPWHDEDVSFKSSLLNQLQLSDDDQFEFFYHGTSHSSVENIMTEIDLKINTTDSLEFGKGFYVTNTLSEANGWAQTKSSNTAVLVFRVCREELRRDGNIDGLDLMNNDNREVWQFLVKNCLSSDSDFPRTLKQYDFIEGPVVNSVDFETNPIPNNDSYQLCVRQQKCASLFDRSLCAVVYFSS